MSEGMSLINLDGLSEPANTLIQKVADGVGGLFAPWQIRRVAKAEADAAITKATAQLQITNLQRRTLERVVAEEAKKQKNMESILEKAIPLLEDDSKPQDIENDWIANFFDKCRLTSDEEMQILWAKVLAGEANSPGKYSRRTVTFLQTLDKSDAALFTNLCRYGWFIGYVIPLVYEPEDSIYGENGIDFVSLKHLDEIGLITFSSLTGFQRTGLPQDFQVFYYGTSVHVSFADEKHELPLGKVMLSQIGQELAHVCDAKPVPGFLEYIFEKWSEMGLDASTR